MESLKCPQEQHVFFQATSHPHFTKPLQQSAVSKNCVIPPTKQLAIITQWIIIALQNLSNQESTTLLWTRWLATYLPTEFHSWTLVSSFTLFHITSSKSSSWHQAVEDDVKSTMSGDDVIEVPRFWFGSLGLGPYLCQPNHYTKVVIGCCWVDQTANQTQRGSVFVVFTGLEIHFVKADYVLVTDGPPQIDRTP